MKKQIDLVNLGQPIDLVKLGEVERACRATNPTLIKLKQAIAAQENESPGAAARINSSSKRKKP